MKLNALLWVVAVSSTIAACGGGGGGGTKVDGGGTKGSDAGTSGSAGSGGTCQAAAPCGGDLEGTWEVTSVCTNGDMAMMMVASMGSGAGLPEGCKDLFQDFTIDMKGTIVFEQGLMTSTLDRTLKGREHITPTCLTALGAPFTSFTESSCSDMESDLALAEDPNTATCTLKAGNCDCDFTSASDGLPEDNNYILSGNQVVDPEGQASPMDYCVSGNTLTLIQSTANAAGFGLVVTLRRQSQ
jgi:hypothetical protein